MAEVYTDEIGRCFCEAHRRSTCHECSLAFDMVNEMMEQQAGLKKPPSRARQLAEDFMNCQRGLDFIRKNGDTTFLRDNEDGLREAREGLEALVRSGDASQDEVEAALGAAHAKKEGTEAELRAVYQKWREAHPNETTMSFGGAETQRIYDEVAAKPPSAASAKVDKRTCGWCGAASGDRLLVCAQCKDVAYCDRDCQKAAWPGHKIACKKATKADATTAPKGKLPLTWAQLEAIGHGVAATGKVLEVRAVEDQSVLRQVFACKDRAGDVRRIAAYTAAKRIPGLASGKVLRWKHPRFAYFMDGSNGARIEQEDLANIKVL